MTAVNTNQIRKAEKPFKAIVLNFSKTLNLRYTPKIIPAITKTFVDKKIQKKIVLKVEKSIQ